MAEELARVLASGLVIKAPRRAIVRESSSRVTRYKVYRELGVNWKTMVSILRAYRSLYSPYEVFDYPFDRG